jgi:hypothetical protein
MIGACARVIIIVVVQLACRSLRCCFVFTLHCAAAGSAEPLMPFVASSLPAFSICYGCDIPIAMGGAELECIGCRQV